ncbi:MAG: 30S ribosomal protein S6 [Bacteroidetes bacterium]|nr:30S ribosomal protein S6 [Bacteroidota bacterium]HET6243933.1 30S ribosomal protein S6 [Bacteroidia bacterium]
MSNRYETVFIMTPVLSEEQTKEAVNKYKQYLLDNGAKIKHEENWGLRKLAYPIQKKSTGFYHLVEFEAEGTVIAGLEVQFKRDERILRFLTVALDKHALAYAEKKRNKSKNSQPQEAKSAEA